MKTTVQVIENAYLTEKGLRCVTLHQSTSLNELCEELHLKIVTNIKLDLETAPVRPIVQVSGFEFYKIASQFFLDVIPSENFI